MDLLVDLLVDQLADQLADPLADPLADLLATRRTRKYAGWRRNAPSRGHRGATDAAGVADATDGRVHEKEN